MSILSMMFFYFLMFRFFNVLVSLPVDIVSLHFLPRKITLYSKSEVLYQRTQIKTNLFFLAITGFLTANSAIPVVWFDSSLSLTVLCI